MDLGTLRVYSNLNDPMKAMRTVEMGTDLNGGFPGQAEEQ